MTHKPEKQRTVPPSVACPGASGAFPGSVRGGRTARFAAGFPLLRLLAIGGLIVAAWLFVVVYGVFGPAMSVAGMHAQLSSHNVAGPVLPDVLHTALPKAQTAGPLAASSASANAVTDTGGSGGFPTATDNASADAEAMAGRTVDGLTSQSKPLLPSPSAVDYASDHGLVPQTSGMSMLFGDDARAMFEPRFTRLPAPMVAVRPPVVRTAADDPSYSPD